MSEAAIGTQMAIRAIFHIGLMPFYSYMEVWFGTTVQLHRTLMWIWPLSVLCIPFLNILARIYGEDSWTLSIALLGYYLVWSTSNFTWREFYLISLVAASHNHVGLLVTVAIMVTDASPCPEALSTINVCFFPN